MPNKLTRFIKIGDKFDRLSVVGIVSTEFVEVFCKCSPDKIYKTRKYELLDGETKSCGCLSRDRTIERNISHNKCKLKIYNIFLGMVHRCYRKEQEGYKIYGGKGIRICQYWNPYLLGWKEAFENFLSWSRSSKYEEGLSIDRINSNNDYSPNNCMWISKSANCGKHSRCKYHFINGINKKQSEWIIDDICLVSVGTVYKRVANGESFEQAIKTPPRKRVYKK